MSEFHICPLSAVNETVARTGVRRMVSFCGPGKAADQPTGMNDGHVVLEFNDIGEPREGLIEPKREHIQTLLDTFDLWGPKQSIILHCWMGISRSTAAALIGCAYFDPNQDMRALATRLRRLSPMATPNPLMITLADDMLGLSGELKEGVEAIGRGAEAFEGQAFTIAHAETASP